MDRLSATRNPVVPGRSDIAVTLPVVSPKLGGELVWQNGLALVQDFEAAQVGLVDLEVPSRRSVNCVDCGLVGLD
jgi:hypothetical protein